MSVVVMVTAVGVVNRVTGGRRRCTVAAVVEAALAVARPVTDAVLEQVVAVDALSDRRTVAIDGHVVTALESVVVANVRVTFLLHTITANHQQGGGVA